MKSLISIPFAAVLIVALLALLTPPVCGSPDESMYCGNQNCYEVLQVDRSSADLQKDVKKSYRKLSLKYHPDKNKDPDAADQFVAISTAYGVLSNDDQREAYDYYLDHPQEAMYNRYRFYQTKYAPKTDVRVAIAVLLLFISMCQYVFQVQEHRRVVNQLRASNRVASSARLLAMRESSKEASQAKRNGDKLSPYIDRVLETMYENGSLVKPSVTSVLVFQLLYLPLRAPQFLKWIEQVRENKKREIKEREAEEMEEKLRAVHLAKMANDRKQRKQLAIKKQKDKQRLKQSKEDKQRASEKAEREKNEKELKLRRKCKREVMAAAKALSNVDDATELVHDIDIVFSWPDVEKDSWKQIADQVKASPSTNDWILSIKRIAKEYRLEIDKKKKSLSNQLEQQDKARVARLTKPWHDRELAMLSKGTAKFPGGTKNRWQMIAAYVNSAGVGNERDAQQCIQKFQQSRPSVPRPGTTQQHSQTGDEVDDWSTEQQSKLEDGLSKFPSSMNKKERWNSIANLVPGKSAKQCAIRFKEIRTQIIAKNSASG